jgi:RNA polymerase sigma-70 factor (ECF subfamily)
LLVVRWQRGDREAFAGIVEHWERSLFFYLRRLAPSEADAWELLQETWLKLLGSLKSLRDPHAFPAFLYATARNAAVSRFRGLKRMAEIEHEEVPDARSLNDLPRSKTPMRFTTPWTNSPYHSAKP